jgi:addiction module RelE/StbE family toxin
MTYTISWRPTARKALTTAARYIAYDLINPHAAIDFTLKVDERVSLLAATGTKFRQGKVAGTYEYVVTPTTILIYRVFEKAKRIEIIRLLPAAQNT